MRTFGQNRSFPETENPADAGFLIGNYRPTPVIRQTPMNSKFIPESGRSVTACDLYLTNPKQLVSDEKNEGGKHTVKPSQVDSGLGYQGRQQRTA